MSELHTTIVTIPEMIAPADWKKLEAKSKVQYIECREPLTEDELLEAIKNSDYLMLDPDAVGFELKESFYQRLTEQKFPLKAISADITGMSWASPEAATKYGIPLMNTADYSGVSVAEFTVGLILVHAKRLHSVWLDRLSGNEERPYVNEVLQGKTIGIVGLGNIGTKVAGLLQGFGVNLVGWDRKDKNLPNVKQLSLEEVLEQSDYLSIHLKTTDETTGLFNAELLSRAKPGQCIINEADGVIVDNDALYEAIQQGRISGYACANSAVEGTPLATDEHVICFPSQAWYTEHSLHLLREIWVGNILSAINGKLQNVVE